jgi:hypothetical protein
VELVYNRPGSFVINVQGETMSPAEFRRDVATLAILMRQHIIENDYKPLEDLADELIELCGRASIAWAPRKFTSEDTR